MDCPSYAERGCATPVVDAPKPLPNFSNINLSWEDRMSSWSSWSVIGIIPGNRHATAGTMSSLGNGGMNTFPMKALSNTVHHLLRLEGQMPPSSKRASDRSLPVICMYCCKHRKTNGDVLASGKHSVTISSSCKKEAAYKPIQTKRQWSGSVILTFFSVAQLGKRLPWIPKCHTACIWGCVMQLCNSGDCKCLHESQGPCHSWSGDWQTSEPCHCAPLWSIQHGVLPAQGHPTLNMSPPVEKRTADLISQNCHLPRTWWHLCTKSESLTWKQTFTQMTSSNSVVSNFDGSHQCHSMSRVKAQQGRLVLKQAFPHGSDWSPTPGLQHRKTTNSTFGRPAQGSWDPVEPRASVQNPLSFLLCARSRGDTNRSEHHTAFSEMKKMTRKCAVSCQVVVRQFTDCNIL